MKKNHSISLIFTMSLILLFTVLSALVLYMGVESYNRIMDRRSDNISSISTIAYIGNKLNQAYVSGGVYEDTVGSGVFETSAIRIKVDEGVSTVIYYYNGYLYEYTLLDEWTFTLDLGERICKVDSFDFDIYDNYVYYTVVIDGNTHSMKTALR